jgi:hypothetical protein
MVREGNFHQCHIPFGFSVDHFPFHQIPIGESDPNPFFPLNDMVGSNDPTVVTDNETITSTPIMADDRNDGIEGEDHSLVVGEEGICSVSPKGF